MESWELMPTGYRLTAGQFQEEPRSKSLLIPLPAPHLTFYGVMLTAYNAPILLVTPFQQIGTASALD